MAFAGFADHVSCRFVMSGSGMGRMEMWRSPAIWVVCLLVLVLATSLIGVEGKPFPAPQLKYCNSPDGCCPPQVKGNVKAYTFNTRLPWRTRSAAQFASPAYIAKIQKAYALLRALPASDGRSWQNQAKLHCAYCGGAFYYSGQDYPLEIHNSWFFLPWHRLYLYFHERILANLLNDDTFALPFWNWDNQSPTQPLGNVMPAFYANKMYNGKTSSLWDTNRNRCAMPPNIVDLNSAGGCTVGESASWLRSQNTRLMYTQLVTGAPISSLFLGQPYRFGDPGPQGGGTLEDTPHGPVHVFTGNPNARIPFNDMGNLNAAAMDPLFFAHHANVDRLWEVWKQIPGGSRLNLKDPDWLNTAFTFYDENGHVVTATVANSLSLNLLRYSYQNVANPWAPKLKTGSVTAASVATDSINTAGPSIPTPTSTVVICSPLTNQQVLSLIGETPPLGPGPTVLSTTPLSFRVRRPPANANGVEILRFQGVDLDWTLPAHVDAYLFYPNATIDTSVTCAEFFGTFNNVPHDSHSLAGDAPRRVWQVAIGPKLTELGLAGVSHVVVTLVQKGTNDPQKISFSSVSILYLTS